jgi:hypothetical protein
VIDQILDVILRSRWTIDIESLCSVGRRARRDELGRRYADG